MPKYHPLKYRDVVKILKNLGFTQETSGSTSHQTWVLKKNSTFHAVTLSFHGTNIEYKRGTLSSIIRQSGVSKEKFYQARTKRRKRK